MQSNRRPIRDYRDLVVWTRAIELVPRLYEVAAQFPRFEMFSLSDQVRRAAVSVPANIAEGQGRQHRKEFIQHLAIARGSLAELDTLLVVANRIGYVRGQTVRSLEAEIAELRKMLSSLIARLKIRG